MYNKSTFHLMEKVVWLKCFETLFPFFLFFLAGFRLEGENKMNFA